MAHPSKKNITMDDFETFVKPRLVSLRNGHITKEKLDKCHFVENFVIHGVKKTGLYDYDTQEFIAFDQPMTECACCGVLFRVSHIRDFVKKTELICPCCHHEKTHVQSSKVQCVKNTQDGDVSFKTVFQRRFLNWCCENGMLVTDGERSVSYEMKGGVHEYSIQYYFPDIDTYLDICDNKIWLFLQKQGQGRWTHILRHLQLDSINHILLSPFKLAYYKKVLLQKHKSTKSVS